MTDFTQLDILLHGQRIGTLNHLPGDRNLFSFVQEYMDDPAPPVLSLSFRDSQQTLITEIKSTRTRVPPFFANLLPEGQMRDYLATQAKVSPQREFYLLAALGQDLPGALKIVPSRLKQMAHAVDDKLEEMVEADDERDVLRFSLAGVQLKFSAQWEAQGQLTIPCHGVGGSWILKLPSPLYAGVAENEFVMMELARQIGINVPETALISLDQIKGLPKGIALGKNKAFVTKRFDRDQEGQAIHIEDFAQVFGVYPEKKYRSANYQNIADVIHKEMGTKGVIEFIRRFVFNALIGNGDMHLKNWSLIYPDKKNGALAPAYDFVSTIPYIFEDELALNFVDSKKFSSLTSEQFKRFANKVQLPQTVVLETVEETVQAFRTLWRSIHEFPLDKKIVEVIDTHLNTIPFYIPK